MKYIITFIQILFLCLLAFIGDWISATFHLPVPGSIIGMVFLFVSIRYHVIPVKWIARAADLLLKEMILFFIPSTVAIIRYWNTLAANGIGILSIIFISTVSVILVTGLCTEYFVLKRGKQL